MKKYLFLITLFLTALVASGATYYVVPGGAGSKNGTSWANAYADVQTAIDSASSDGGGEVWIAKGTYKHGSEMTMKNNVAIYGGFAGTETSKDQRVEGNNTILDGEGKYRVFYNYYTSSNKLTNSAKLDNVTIQNGYASYGGAGMCNNYASPEITNCTFSGNSASHYGGGMYNDSSSPVLTNCTFSGNSAGDGGGMYNTNSSPILTNCTFTNNSASGGGGMYNYDSSSPKLTNCTFTNNSAGSGGGMYNLYSSPSLTNCILWGNTASYSGNEISNLNSNSNPTIDTCIIKGGKDGIYGSDYCTFTTEPITADPKLMPLGNYGGSVKTCPVGAGSSAIGAGKVVESVTADARGFVRSTTPTIGACEYQNKLTVASISTSEGYLKYSSSYEFTLNVNVPDVDGTFTYQWYKDGVAIAGATFSSYKTSQSAETSKYTVVVSDGSSSITSSEIAIETVDIPRYYVSTEGSSENDGLSWATAKSDVQEAIDLASEYYGIEVWIAKGTYKHGSAMTMKNGVAIYGGFAGTETSKDQRVSGNNTILDGEREYRVFYNNYTSSNKLTNSAKLDNVTIQNGYANGSNSSDKYGAGMYNYYASPEITNCTFTNNSAGGSYYGYGGGMCNYYSSSPVLTNCTFTNNSASGGGGMYNSDSSSPVLTNCTFSGNRASGSSYGYGGGMYNSGSSTKPVLTNCTFSNNSADAGGGMYNSGSDPVLTNCTFSSNSASGSSYGYGGGMYNYYSSSPTLTNCILWGNTATSSGNEIYTTSNSNPTIDTCIIEGGYSSYGTYTNIITSDPKLMPLGNYGGNVQTCPVGTGSSAIGAGKVVEGVTTDARGFIRSVPYTIGACQYCPTEITSQPLDTTIWANTQDGVLTVSVSIDNPTYQWQYSEDGSTWYDIEGETSSTLTLSNVPSSQSGYKYRCAVDSDNGDLTYSSVAILTVKPSPTLDNNPTGFEVWSNVDRTLSVSATGEELTYQWYFNGEAIEGATESTLSFDNIQFDKTGSYYCVITNPAGSVQSSTANVVVRQSVTEDSITKKLEKVTTISGTGYARFIVETTAYNPTYKWYYGSGDTWTEFEETSNILFIPAESKYNRKNIKCEISNGGGSVSTQAVLVYSSTAIQITSQPQDVSFKLNENASFNVTVSTSTGNAYYQWQYSADSNEWQNIENATESTYSFKMMDSKNRGYYRCEIDNGGGILYSENAKIIFPEDVAITTQPTAITSAIIGAKATFTVVVSGDYPKYQWQVSYDYGDTWENIAGATNGTLGVDVVENIVDNSYRCLVWNDNNVDAPLESEMVWIENVIEPTAFQEWSMANGLGVDASPSATPHNDGITNLEKFTFGLDASKATSYGANANFKHSTDASGNASLQFPVSVDAEGVVNVKALKSVDLINWTEIIATATGETSSDGKFKIYKATAPIGEEGKVFLKLKVEEK